MLPRGLFLKLWWLVLPLSIIARPEPGRVYEKRTLSDNLGPPDSAPISPGLEDRNSADVLDRRAAPAGDGDLAMLNADGEPLWMTRLFAAEDPLQPVLHELNATNDLNTKVYGYGSFKDVKEGPYQERLPFSFYFPPDDIPFPPSIEGWIDDEVNAIQCLVVLMGHRVGYLDGDLDRGAFIIANLAVAKGRLDIWRADDDYVYLKADLHFPLRVHINHTWRLFHLPHEQSYVSTS
ncbi:MAG: hypothetical protein Q9207_003312 [Kuettlingeria erythrocarpa]